MAENKGSTTRKSAPKSTTGTKRTTSKSQSAGSSSTRRSSAKKGSGKGRKKTQAQNSIVDEIIVLIAFAFAAILILSNYNLAGSVGKGIKWFMFGLIGVVEYIFPIVLALTLIFLVSNKDLMAVARIKSVAIYCLTIIIAAIWQRISNSPSVEDTMLGEFFTNCAENKSGGGLLGGLICKLLSPLGIPGTMVILVILAIICIIIITEKSFIQGVAGIREKSSNVVHAALDDYDVYKEHSNEKIKAQKERREEYRAKKLEKEKEQRELEQKAFERMNKKAKGVTKDTELPRNNGMVDMEADMDIHEIVVDTERNDEFSGDIYSVNDFENGREKDLEKNSSKKRIPTEDEFYNDLFVEADEFDEQPKEAQPDEVVTDDYVQSDIDKTQEIFQNQSDINKNDISQTDKQENEHQAVMEPLEQSQKKTKKEEYVFPPLNLLNKGKGRTVNNQSRENKDTALRLQQTLQNFGVKVTITDISCGPSVTRYELQPEQGVKVSKIVSLADDIKLNLAAADIRIEAPIPGKAAIGIEVPNKEAGSVSFRELIESSEFKNTTSPIAFGAGKDIAGKIIIADIAKMPHLLIAGATGSGKSVCINTIIMSILYKAHPDDVKLIMVDPKVVELSVYNGIPHLLTPVVTDPKKASGALNWAVVEMDKRYKMFAQMNVRDLKGYNAKIEKLDVPDEERPEKMPQIVIIIDELADLMMVASGEVEDSICRLAQLARAAGIHLIIATQRPSVNVITGLIKANVPSRIAFSVSSGVDSRTIIDMNGAEKLLGKGDMLFFPSGYPKPVRVQGAFVTDEEVGNVVDFLKSQVKEEIVYNEEITNTAASAVYTAEKEAASQVDPLFEEAGIFVIEKEKGSIGMIQRNFKVGFNRAGRIMDQLADAGVVGPEIGTKPRKILMTVEEFKAYLSKNS